MITQKQLIHPWKNPSFLLKLEDLKEQVNFLENEKLLLKEQLDNFKSNKIQLFKLRQYSNITHAAYQELISYAGVSANKVDKVNDTDCWDLSRSSRIFQKPFATIFKCI